MEQDFNQWVSYLSINDATIEILKKNYWIVEKNINVLLDNIYGVLSTFPDTAKFYADQASMLRAKEHQKKHWMQFVFKGNFNEDYSNAVKRIGKTHHKLGVDIKFYSGAYCIMMTNLAKVVRAELKDNVEAEFEYLSALNRVIFMDMGLATATYYDSISADLENLAEQLNIALARAGEFRDNETGAHIHRMSRMCYELAKCIDKDISWCEMILLASPLHDVGKIGVPDSVLLKPGKLNENEWECMMTHPFIGGEIVPDSNSEVIQMAKRISLTHHEKWDGSGYPVGLKGEEIPLEGRIAAICDVFDALVSKRPYKEPWPLEQVIQYMKENSGKHFDPYLIEVFLNNIPKMLEIQDKFQESRFNLKPDLKRSSV